jgi:uncharacterized protein
MKNCPVDNVQLMEINKSGVMIDVCPECKGVWLDRGELEKIVNITKDLEAEFNRDQPPFGTRVKERDQSREPERDRYRDDSRYETRDTREKRYRDDDDDDNDDRSRRGKRGVLGKIFDIFD